LRSLPDIQYVTIKCKACQTKSDLKHDSHMNSQEKNLRGRDSDDKVYRKLDFNTSTEKTPRTGNKVMISEQKSLFS